MSKNKKIEAIIVIYNTFFKATNAACMFQQNNKQQANKQKMSEEGTCQITSIDVILAGLNECIRYNYFMADCYLKRVKEIKRGHNHIDSPAYLAMKHVVNEYIKVSKRWEKCTGLTILFFKFYWYVYIVSSKLQKIRRGRGLTRRDEDTFSRKLELVNAKIFGNTCIYGGDDDFDE